MDWDTIRMEIDENMAIITIDRPKQMNALNAHLLGEMMQALDKAAKDQLVRVVVIQGTKKFFCAGADISEVVKMTGAYKGFIFLQKAGEVFKKLESLPKPVVAAVQGLALGGGCELALACDLRLASESARFGVPEVAIGAFPAGGGTSRLPRIIGPTRAKEMVFFGEPVSGREALEMGLVNRVFADDTFGEEVLAYARKLAQKAPVAIRLAKQSMDSGYSLDNHSSRDIEALLGAMAMGTEDGKEGMRAFAEKRKPVFRGE